MGILTSECGLNSKWFQTAMQLTKLRLETEAKEHAKDDTKASDTTAKAPDGKTIESPSVSAAASSTEKQSEAASVASAEAAAVVSTVFHRGDLVRMITASQDISNEESELRPGPLLSFEVGDVFESIPTPVLCGRWRRRGLTSY